MKAFTEKVWDEIKKVPRGKVTTYKRIAARIGTKAYRAVGSAVGRNIDMKNIQCYRVVKSDSRVGGYAGGVKTKMKLLIQDGLIIRKDKIMNFKESLY